MLVQLWFFLRHPFCSHGRSLDLSHGPSLPSLVQGSAAPAVAISPKLEVRVSQSLAQVACWLPILERWAKSNAKGWDERWE